MGADGQDVLNVVIMGLLIIIVFDVVGQDRLDFSMMVLLIGGFGDVGRGVVGGDVNSVVGRIVGENVLIIVFALVGDEVGRNVAVIFVSLEDAAGNSVFVNSLSIDIIVVDANKDAEEGVDSNKDEYENNNKA
jgi:hypothetical protein